MFSDISQYYYSDWIGFVMTVLWIYYAGEKKRIGFIFAIIGSIAWMIFGYLTQSIASMVANATFIALNIQAYRKWKR